MSQTITTSPFHAHTSGQIRRSLLNVILWLPIQDIVLAFERVSKTCQHLVQNKELWTALILRDIYDVETSSTMQFPDLRTAYRVMFVRKSYLYFWKPKSNMVAKFNPANEQIKAILNSALDGIDCTSAYLFLNDGRLLACGGQGGIVMGVMMYFRTVHLVDMHTVQMKRSHDMWERKIGMELVELRGFVYSFGGHNMRKLRTVERASIQNFVWEKYGEMPAAEEVLSGTTYLDKIYLASGTSQRLQVYDPVLQTFTRRGILPLPFTKGLSIISSHEWVLMHDCKTSCVIDLASFTCRMQSINCDFELDLTGAYGVRRRNNVYFVSHDPDQDTAGIFKLDLQQFRITTSVLINQ